MVSSAVLTACAYESMQLLGHRASPGWRLEPLQKQTHPLFQNPGREWQGVRQSSPPAMIAGNQSSALYFQLFPLFLPSALPTLPTLHAQVYQSQMSTESQHPQGRALWPPESGNRIWFPVEMEKARGPLSVLLLRPLGKGVEVWWQLQGEAGCVLRALSCAGWGQQGEGPAHIGILKG